MATTAAARAGPPRRGPGDAITSVDIDQFNEEVLAFYKAKRASPSTFTLLGQLFQALREIGVRNTAELNELTVRRFDAHIQPKLSLHHRCDLLRMFRAVCNHAVKSMKRLSSCPPFPLLPRPGEIPSKVPKASRAAPTLKEMKDLWDYLQVRASTWEGYRLFALFAVVTLSGIGKTEALRLETSDVDLVGEVLWIWKREEKRWNGLPTQVRMSSDLKWVLAGWLRQNAGCQWVFPGARRAGPWKEMKRGFGPLNSLRAAAKAVKIKRDVTFDLLRQFHEEHAVTTVDLGRHQAPSTEKNGKAPTSSTSSLPAVEMKGPGFPILVNGVPKKLTPSEHRIIGLLLQVWPGGLSLKGMNMLYGKTSWRQLLITLRKDVDWGAAIGCPGPVKTGKISDLYRILPRRSDVPFNS